MPGPLFHKFVIAMWQNAQKTVRKFCGSKEDKNKETHPEKPKKAKPGAFWVLEGMGTVENGSNQMRKPGVRTKTNPKTMQHMQKENRRKPSVFAGFLAGAEGLDLGCRLGRAWTQPTGLQAPTTRTAQGAAVPRCQILPHTNEKVRYRTSDT